MPRIPAERIQACMELGALGDRLGSTMEGVPAENRRLDWESGLLNAERLSAVAEG